MSLKLVYTSDPLHYDPNPSSPQSIYISYPPLSYQVSNPIIRSGARAFDEAMSYQTGMTVNPSVFGVIQRRTPLSRDANIISVVHTIAQYYHGATVGIGFYADDFDPKSGAWLGRSALYDDYPNNGLPIYYRFNDFRFNQITPDAVWGFDSNVSNYDRLYKFSSADFSLLEGPIDTEKYLDAPGWGYGAILKGYYIDETADLLIAYIQNNDVNFDYSYVELRSFTSGAFIGKINACGVTQKIVPAGNGLIYCINEYGGVTLIDYLRKEALACFRLQTPTDIPVMWGTNINGIGWDFMYKRLLTCFIVDDDPVTGACNTRVNGYYPNPIPVGLTQPIPLNMPRVGRETRFVSRAYGDAGEPISGVTATWGLS